jgi:hypothetical protein
MINCHLAILVDNRDLALFSNYADVLTIKAADQIKGVAG